MCLILENVFIFSWRGRGRDRYFANLSYDISAGKGHTFKYMFDNAGTIRSSQKFLVKHQRRQLVSLLGETSDPEERRQIQQSIINCGSEETLYSQLEWPSDKINNARKESNEDSS